MNEYVIYVQNIIINYYMEYLYCYLQEAYVYMEKSIHFPAIRKIQNAKYLPPKATQPHRTFSTGVVQESPLQ